MNHSYPSKVHVEKPYECSICQKSFATTEKLDEHRDKHFSEKKVLPCDICHKTFKAAGNLRKHLMKRHNLENELKVPNDIEMPMSMPMSMAMSMPMEIPNSNKSNNVLNLSQSLFQRHEPPSWM